MEALRCGEPTYPETYGTLVGEPPWTRHPGLSQAPRPGACQRRQMDHGDTLGSWWTERSPASTAMRKVIGSRSCRAAIASTSGIVRPSNSKCGCWKQKGGARRLACRSHAPNATEPNCRRACDCSGRVQSGTSTRCHRASDGLTELREPHGVESSCARDDYSFVLRPNPSSRSCYIPARPRRSLPSSTASDVAAREDGDLGSVVRKILPDGADALFDTTNSLGSAGLGAIRDGGLLVTWTTPQESEREITTTKIYGGPDGQGSGLAGLMGPLEGCLTLSSLQAWSLQRSLADSIYC
jgi:hypothetical protein